MIFRWKHRTYLPDGYCTDRSPSCPVLEREKCLEQARHPRPFGFRLGRITEEKSLGVIRDTSTVNSTSVPRSRRINGIDQGRRQLIGWQSPIENQRAEECERKKTGDHLKVGHGLAESSSMGEPKGRTDAEGSLRSHSPGWSRFSSKLLLNLLQPKRLACLIASGE